MSPVCNRREVICMRSKDLVLMLAALAMVVALAACSAAGQPGGQGGGQNKQETPDEEQAQNKQERGVDRKMSEEAKEREVAPQQGDRRAADQRQTRVEPPKDTTMTLTVPKMAEIKSDAIPTGLGTNDALLREYAGVHLKRTGFPWQREANVYIAGHRIGFPGTDSDMAFYDLNELGEGDEVYLSDSEGRKYTYVVFDKRVVPPTDLSVLRPIKAKNIVSLQTCTLPDYSRRLIVRAELKDIQS